MKTEDLQRRCSEINSLIDANRLSDALTRLRAFAEGLMAYEISDAIDRVADTYRYMLVYARRGVADPQRPAMYASIVEQIRHLLDRLTDKALSSQTPTLYYNVKRYEQMQAGDTVASLLEQYRDRLSGASLFTTAGMTAGDDVQTARGLEACEKRLFNRVWTAMPLSDADMTALSSALGDPVIPSHTRRLLMSALSMGLLQYYDSRRLTLLLEAYAADTGDEGLAMTALAGALIGMFKHNRRVTASQDIARRIAVLRDTTPWSEDVRMMFLEFIRTRDTERIDKTFREDIIPKISKITPDLKRSFSNIDPENIDPDNDINPEWAELLEKSGINERLRELSEMQEQGSDVMMGTFAMMKTFPFFNDISNWFLPFHTGHSEYMALDEDMRDMLTTFCDGMRLCDSDRYSLMLSMSSMSGKQRGMFSHLQNMTGDAREMLEQARDMMTGTPADVRRRAANHYVRDLYRFFKLFRRKGEFADPFDNRLNLLTVGCLREDFSDIGTVRIVAEFYFKHRQWSDALAVMKRLESDGEISAPLFQKMGYCCQQSGDEAAALEYYRRAELLDADSPWLMKRMARCCRALGDHKEATLYYTRLDSMQPDDFGTTMALGTLALESGDCATALKYLHKAEFINERSTKPWRPIAWAALISGDFDKADSYYRRIMDDNPDSTDILNMGHLQLIRGDVAGALERYHTAASIDGKGAERLIKLIRADVPELRRLGVPDDLITLLPDLVTLHD